MRNTKNLAASSARPALTLLLGLAASTALAQGQAVLDGTVTDAATRQPVADAVVTATSPALQGEQVVVTDATGTYRIAQLPPGPYTIRVEKETYKPYSRGDIDLHPDRTVRLNIELLPEALRGEEIVVVGRPPTIDVGSSTTGINVGKDFTQNLALSRPTARGGAQRSFESLALVAPQVQADAYGMSINGTTSPENSYLIDGISVNNPGFGLLGSPITSEFVEDVSVITGGYMPEYGRSTGGVLSALTKSGSNEFHGSVFGSLTPGTFSGSPKELAREGGTISTKAETWNIGDFGATLGGPIVRDQLWFFAGIQPSLLRSRVTRNLNYTQFDANGRPMTDPETGKTLTAVIPGATTYRFADSRSYQYIGKLTYHVNQNNNLSVSVVGTPTTSGGDSSLSIDNNRGDVITGGTLTGPFETVGRKNSTNSTDAVLKWSSSLLEKRVLLDATAGWHRQTQSSLPVDGSEPGSGQGLSTIPAVQFQRTTPRAHSILDFEDLSPDQAAYCAPPAGNPNAVACPVPVYRTGGASNINLQTYNNWQGKVVGTLLATALGHHVVKAGLDGQFFDFRNSKAYTGGVFYVETSDGTRFSDNRKYGYLTAPDTPTIVNQLATTKSTVIGGFLQDSWNIADQVIVNAGVRYDVQSLTGGDNKTAFTLPNQWSPRIGVVYDVTREGRSKVFASYARYYENVPLDILDRQFPVERQITSLVGRRCNAAVVPNNCGDDSTLVGGGARTNPNRFYNPVGSDKTPVDPDIQAQSSDEIIAGFEYEVLTNSRAGIAYTRRYFNRVIEDMSLDEAQTYFLGNPGYGIAAPYFPKATRDYDALTLYFTKAFADLWLAQASYTLTYLRGNYNGLFRPETEQLDPNIGSDFDLISLNPNRATPTGPLLGDNRHQIKVFGAKEFIATATLSFTLGLSYTGTSGNPRYYLGRHFVYGNGEVFILPRDAGGRTPWVHGIDGRVGLNYRVGRQNVLSATCDVFNIFNFQAATRVDNEYTQTPVLPIPNGTVGDLDTKLQSSDPTTFGQPFDPANKNKNFGNPTRYQQPRTVRFGARLTF